MKNLKLTFLLTVLMSMVGAKAFAYVEINETNFPDERFRNYLLSQDYGTDGIITDDEIAKITKIVIKTPTTSATVSKMQNMKGIEYFTALKELDCSYNEIENLDLSQNKNLEILNCYGGGGSNILGLSGNKNLKAVYTGVNYHKELNLSGCTALTTLDCNVSCRIETLDISGCISLVNLILPYGNMDNQWVYNINASGCSSLKEIRCFKAWVFTLDVSGCTSLENIECYGNTGLNKLNVTGCTALKTLSCGGWGSGCNLGVLDVSTCTAMEELSCGLSQVETLDLSNNPLLRKLGCGNTNLKSLNVSNCPNLTDLDCSFSNLTSLDVSHNPLLSTLLCNNGQLTELNTSANTALTNLSCHENQLSELDLSNNKQLESVYCQQNKLQSLLVSGLSKLKTLQCENNLLETLSVKNNISLTELFCSNNKLTELDVSACKALTRIDCSQNKLAGSGVDAFFESLPALDEGTYYPIYYKNSTDDEGNECTKSQVAVANAKGWNVYKNYYTNWGAYEGIDPVTHEVGDVFTAKTVEGVDMKFRVISETEVEVYGETSSPSIDQSYSGSITIPESVDGFSVTIIGNYAFYECSGLTSVSIPNSVTSIGSSVFAFCRGLTSVTIGNSVTIIGNYAFYKCSGLTSIIIPNSVTIIGNYAFDGCSRLASVAIGNSVTSIGEWAFGDCSSLTSVTIPNSVTRISNSVFGNCSGLTSITVDSGNTKYDSRENCNAIIETKTNILIAGCKSTIIPAGIEFIGQDAFRGHGIVSANIPEGVKSIGTTSFFYCFDLVNVTISGSVVSIANNAFWNCHNLSTIEVNNGNKFYDSREDCNAIIETKTNTLIAGCKNTTIPSSVTAIDQYAFVGCIGLQAVTIPDNIAQLGAYAFTGCDNITSVIVGSETPIAIESNVFSNSANATLYVPAGCKAAYEAADVWKEFGSIVEMESPVAEDGNVIPIDAEKLGLTSEFAAFDESRISYENKNPWGVQGLVEVGSNDKMTVNVTNVQYQAKDLSFDDYDRIVINGDTLFARRGIEGDTNPRTFSSHNPATAMEVPVTGDYLHIVAKESGWAYVALKASMNKSYAVFEDGQAIGYKVALGNNYFPVFNLEIKGDGETNYRTEQINPLLNEYTTNADTLKAMERGSGVGVLYFPVSQGKEYVVCASGAKMRAFGVYYTEQEGVKIKLLSELKDPLVLMEQKETPAPHAIGDIFTATTVEGVDMKFRVISETEVEVYGETSSPSIDQTYAGSITIPESVDGFSVTSLGYESFYSCPALTSVAIPNSVTSITRRAFYGCSSLSTITIPQSVTKIFTNAFYHCSGLNSIVVESGNTVFDSRDNCNAIIETASNRLVQGCSATVIPNSVTSIGSYAFRGRSNLVSIAIPNSVTSIGDGAFAGCSGMKEIVSYIEEPFATNSSCWSNVPTDIPLYVPAGTKEKYQNTDGWKGFTNIIEFGGDAIEPTEETKEVDMSAIPNQIDLNGMVVGDTYYVLNAENGDGADSESGCVVIKSVTSNEAVSNIVGNDISDEIVKKEFKGIIFMVPAGTGRISISAETAGSKVLMVKVGSQAAQSFSLAEREIVKMFCTVSEPTYVYIYAGDSETTAARGSSITETEDGSVKVYSYKWEPTELTGIRAIDNGQWTIDDEAGAWYTLDGRKLISKPAQKGVYIKNGKKVEVK